MVYRLVNSTYNSQELILRLTRLLCQFIKADSSVIYILDAQKKKPVLKAVFDNKINFLLTKKKDLAKITDDEARVLRGYSVFTKSMIGLPLVAEDIVGGIFVTRKRGQKAFNEFDKEMLSVVTEQSVTAIKNLQLYEQQQQVILESMKFIGKLLKSKGHAATQQRATSDFFKLIKILGEKLNLGRDTIDSLYYATVLRDAGAINVPYDILSKKSHLTAEEFKTIREQPAKSVELIKPVAFLKPVLPIILYHHENYDGTGYPSGLKKDQIPIGARVMAVVDAFDAMTSDRPYKKRFSVNEALEEIKRNSGSQFDPKIVDVFLKLSKQKKFRKHLISIT